MEWEWTRSEKGVSATITSINKRLAAHKPTQTAHQVNILYQYERVIARIYRRT